MTAHDARTVEKMLQYCDRIARTIKRVGTFEKFMADEEAPDAAVMRVGQLGELSHRELSAKFKQSLTSVPWSAIYNLRNSMAHGDAPVELLIMWEVMSEDIPVLSCTLRVALETYRAEGGLSRMKLK